MTGRHPLEPHLNVLKTPSQFALDGTRILATASDNQQTAAVLHEINQTILARRLEFSCSSGRTLVLDVVGRRILRLVDVKNALHNLALGSDHTKVLMQVIQDFVAPKTEVRVKTAPLVSTDGLDVGLHIASLAALLMVDLGAPVPLKPPGVLVKFTSLLDHQLSAWILHQTGASDQTHGADDTVTELLYLITNGLDDLVAQLAAVEPNLRLPTLLVVGAKVSADHATLLARADDQLLVGILNGASAKNLQNAWTRAQV